MTQARTTPSSPALGPQRPDADDDQRRLTVIEPPKGWLGLGLAELLRYRELLYFLTWRDIKVRYKQTVVGGAWAVIQPLVSMVVFSIIFGGFARIPSDGVPYPIFVYAGLLPWMLFSGAVSQAGQSLVNQANLLTKVYFPRLLVPASAAGVSVVDFGVSFLVYAGIMLWYMRPPGASALLLPLVTAMILTGALGAGYLLAGVTVIYRDFRHVIGFLMQVWMYASPVVYSTNMVPQKYRLILAVNPMFGLIGAFRSALLNQAVDWWAMGVSSAVSLGLLALGVYHFRRNERRFADVA